MRRWVRGVWGGGVLLVGAFVAPLAAPSLALAEVSDKEPGVSELVVGFVVSSLVCAGAWRWHRVAGFVAFSATGLLYAALALELSDPLVGSAWVREVGSSVVGVSVAGTAAWLSVNLWGGFRALRLRGRR